MKSFTFKIQPFHCQYTLPPNDFLPNNGSSRLCYSKTSVKYFNGFVLVKELLILLYLGQWLHWMSYLVAKKQLFFYAHGPCGSELQT